MYSSKSLTGRTFLTVNLAGAVFFAVLFFYFIQPSPARRSFDAVALPGEDIDTLLKQEQISFGVPVRLKIPAINVDATVESLGLTPGGNMDTPKGPDNVAWFNLGNRPGKNGSAVIAGHYGTWKNGRGSVFDNLHKLKKGDSIYMEDEKGETISFVVRESRNYEPSADAKDVFSSDDEKAHLNLITCEGVWNKDAKSYPQRLVVFTDRE